MTKNYFTRPIDFALAEERRAADERAQAAQSQNPFPAVPPGTRYSELVIEPDCATRQFILRITIGSYCHTRTSTDIDAIAAYSAQFKYVDFFRVPSSVNWATAPTATAQAVQS